MISTLAGPLFRQMADTSAIKEVFEKYASKNGFLNNEELSSVLKSLGRFRDADITIIFEHMDKNQDGKVTCEEFLEWIQSSSGGSEESKARQLLKPSADTEIMCTFLSFCGDGHEDMDGRCFLKLCKDCGLIDKKFGSTDVDLIFARVVEKGKRRINAGQFNEALKQVAAKKGVSERSIREVVTTAGPPIIKGTKTDSVRLHDDKTSYTGSHAHGHMDGIDSGLAALGVPTEGADRRISSKSSAPPEAAFRPDVDSNPKSMHDVFVIFCGSGQQTMDNRSFVKLCKDCQLIDKGFSSNDADIAFAKACEKGQRRIGENQFEDAIFDISEKTGVDYGDLIMKIIQNGRPVLTATRADNVRFHDDKSTYTGSHVTKASD